MGHFISMTLMGVGVWLGGAPDAVWIDRETVVLGATLRVELEAETDDEAGRVVDRLFGVARALEVRWATAHAESELSIANRAEPGLPVALGEATFDLLARAWDLSDRTDGAFEPAAGALVDLWGLRGAGEPANGDISRALASSGRGCFDLSPATRTIARRCPDAWIDTGGFGKGAALAALQAVLEDEGIVRARIDFGDQLLVHGAPRTPGAAVRLADPRDARRVAFEWGDVRGALATTRQARSPSADGGGIVVDPRTGLPVPAWGSATVRSADPIEADALATALFVMGPDDALRWLAARPSVEAVLLVERGGGLVACGRDPLVEVLTPVHPSARLSTAPLVAPTLRACS